MAKKDKTSVEDFIELMSQEDDDEYPAVWRPSSPERDSLNAPETTEKVQKISSIKKDVSVLSGKQKNVFLYLVERAKFFGSEASDGSRLTPQISAQELAENASQRNVRATREVVRELLKWGLGESYRKRSAITYIPAMTIGINTASIIHFIRDCKKLCV